jgi:phospholipid/cholesterol/gamma-HCH transport system substrate-binding protein
MLCDGASIRGSEGASLSSLTTLMHKMLTQVEQDQLVDKVAEVATSINQTSKEATAFLVEGRGLVKDGKGLVTNLDASVHQIQPTLTNLNAGSAQLRQLIAALDNPKMLGDLQQTMSNAERLTAQWEAVGGDVHQLTADPRFMDGLRNVAVGLGQFFEELYPAQTGAAKERSDRDAAQQRQQQQLLQDTKTPPTAKPR